MGVGMEVERRRIGLGTIITIIIMIRGGEVGEGEEEVWGEAEVGLGMGVKTRVGVWVAERGRLREKGEVGVEGGVDGRGMTYLCFVLWMGFGVERGPGKGV